MYQSIYFNRQPGPDQWKYFLRDDKKGISSFNYWPTVYRINEEGTHKTLFGDRCSPVKGKFDRADPKILEKDISKELVYLRDQYYQTDDVPEYHNILYLDIEMEIIGPLNPVTIRQAEATITSIALIDYTTKERIGLLLDIEGQVEESFEGDTKIIPFKTEEELLKRI